VRHPYLDKYSDLDSPIHKLDPRAKLIGLVGFILFIVLTRPSSFISFSLYACLIVILILLSGVPFGFILRRSLVIIPFVLVIVALVPFFTQGRAVADLSLGWVRLTVTYEGMLVLCNVLARAFLSILCTTLLIATTRFSDLLKALERLRCPLIFITVLSFMYRYAFLIADELMKMKQAKEARSVGAKRWFHIRTLANMLGVLFIRSYERAESVYLSMRSRGFESKVRTIDEFKFAKKDLFFLLIMAALLTGITAMGK
jgi:cobalt/nickel transport system permease protein